MTESLERRRKRLRYRCGHRGMKELDLLLESFAERHLTSLTGDQLDRLEALLDAVPEPRLLDWIIGRETPAPEHDHDVMTLLRNFKYI